MNELLQELAAMAKRFTELYDDIGLGLCCIGCRGISQPYVQLNAQKFRKTFSAFESDETYVRLL